MEGTPEPGQRPDLEQQIKSANASFFRQKRNHILDKNELSIKEKILKLRELYNAFLRIAQIEDDDAFKDLLNAYWDADKAGLGSGEGATGKRNNKYKEQKAIRDITERLKELDSGYEGWIVERLINSGTINPNQLESSIAELKTIHDQGYILLMPFSKETRVKIAAGTGILPNHLQYHLTHLPEDLLLQIGSGKGRVVYYTKKGKGIEDIITHINSRSRRNKTGHDKSSEPLPDDHDEKTPPPTSVSPNTSKPAPQTSASAAGKESAYIKPGEAFKMLLEANPFYSKEIFDQLIIGCLKPNREGLIETSQVRMLIAKTKSYIPFLLPRETLEEKIYGKRSADSGFSHGIITPGRYNTHVISILQNKQNKQMLSVGEGQNIVYYISEKLTKDPVNYLRARAIIESDIIRSLETEQVIQCLNILLQPDLERRTITQENFKALVNNHPLIKQSFQGFAQGPYDIKNVKTVFHHLLEPGSRLTEEICRDYSTA